MAFFFPFHFFFDSWILVLKGSSGKIKSTITRLWWLGCSENTADIAELNVMKHENSLTLNSDFPPHNSISAGKLLSAQKQWKHTPKSTNLIVSLTGEWRLSFCSNSHSKNNPKKIYRPWMHGPDGNFLLEQVPLQLVLFLSWCFPGPIYLQIYPFSSSLPSWYPQIFCWKKYVWSFH